ncbi:hypothetical protein C3B51_14880 [Pseudoalteromonas rubra]|uniref:Transposase IS4-like domain-containing protein n=1 Tax=Pseudoalteromonas rubra TaxID=43658 RepID=A0A4Q7E716_9GAMM|nr:hypothetical protein C3B51_14880 [Pseudoalteromonas rubra]
MAKGKSAKSYEFDVKVSVATTVRSQFIVASHAMHGNPYDSDILLKTLHIIFDMTNQPTQACYVDRGYKGHMAQRYEIDIA